MYGVCKAVIVGVMVAGLLCDQCGVSASCSENIGARQGCLQRFAIMLSCGSVGNVFMRSAKRESFSVKAKPRAALVFCQRACIARVREDGVS